MDFLKSAVASAISKGPPFPYTFGDRVDVDQSIWILFNGTKRDDGSKCSIFSFDVTNNRSRLPLARNALKKFRTLRHPGVIKILDTVETDTYIYIATERITPLRWQVKRKSMSPETLKWGLYSIAQTVKFINDEASSIHGSLRVSSVYTSESGEWKMGGFEVLSNVKDDDAVIYNYGSLTPDSQKYAAPEVTSGWGVLRQNPLPALDAYSFGIMIFEVFNGEFTGGEQVGQVKSIPAKMQTSYKRLVVADPKQRSSVEHFLEQGRRNGGFFETPLIKLAEGVDNLSMKSETERDQFLSDLDNLSDDFPEDYFRMKILPELLKSIEFGGGGPKVFSVVMKISLKLSEEEFESKITPVVVRLFSSPDRAIRVCLLDNLHLMIERLSQKVVNDKIFPQMVTGFTDLAPVVREQTLKAVLIVITKLSDRTVNGELLKYLAKTANDEQPGIRANTTVCLGRIAKYLGTGSRSKVLIAAFTRSLRDPFVHARNSACIALAVTVDMFNDEDSAGRILPALCPLLIDKEKIVRDQANKTIDAFLAKVRKTASSMADSVLPSPSTTDLTAEQAPRMSTAPSGDGSSWTGWAISSFTNKIATGAGEMESVQPASNGFKAVEARSSSVPASDARRPAPSTTTASALLRQAVASPPLSSARSSMSSNTPDYFADPDKTTDSGSDKFEDWGDAEQERAETMPQDTAAVPAAKPKGTPAPVAVPFDDAGEPDFAGWLAAQSGKKVGTKALPKGLAKPSIATAISNRPSASRIASTGALGVGAGAKRAGLTATKPAAKPTAVVVKKIVPDAKVVDDDEGWGDGW